MNFSSALEYMKIGNRMRRRHHKTMSFVVIMPGYPEMIPINAKTAKAVKEAEGTRLKFNPYLAIMNNDRSMNPWIPTAEDILANDWTEYESTD